MNMINRVLDTLSLQLVRIHGSSMEPALADGSWVFLDRRAFRLPRKPARFDIVRLEDPAARGHWIVKRIVGLPAEEVRLDSGRLFVNQKEIPETHLRVYDEVQAADDRIHEWWPGVDEYVVLGDNRNASTDSRNFGAVPIGALRGRVGKRLR